MNVEGRQKTFIYLKIGVPLRKKTDKKIDSEIVREGIVKRTQFQKESEKILKYKLISI